jgi:phosphate-selective porin OprO/OprP
MKLRYAIAATVFCVYGHNAMAYDWLYDWPTKYKTEGGYEYGFKGLWQFDTNTFSGDNTNPQTGAKLFDDVDAWRRKEMNFYGKTPWGLDFNIGYDYTKFNHTKAGWIDNFIRYTSATAGEFRIGQFKTPVGWEEASSSTSTIFLERALPVQATNMGRRIGADWLYTGIPNWLVDLYYFDGGDLNGDNKGHGPAAHVVWNPLNYQPGSGSREQNNVIHLGFAWSQEDRDSISNNLNGLDNTVPPQARFRARPEASRTDTRLIDTGNLNNPGDINRWGLEGAWIHGPLLVQGEYNEFSASPAGKPDFTGNGYYVFGAWCLTGESHSYSKGYVGNVRPSHDWGAFEIALRYSELDLNDGPVKGGKEDDWTIGANWYLGTHWKLQANYVWANSTKFYANPLNADADVDPRIFEVRAQVYF